MGNYFEVTGSGGSEGKVDFKQKGTANLVFENSATLPGSGIEGQVYWKSDTDELYVYTGSTWKLISATGGTSFPLLAPDGTLSFPSYSFSSEPSTGLYRIGSGSLGLSGQLTISSTLHSYEGLGSNPGIHFQGASSNTGLYSSGDSLLYIVTGGIYANFNTSSYIFNLAGRSSLSAGINGEAATFDVYPSGLNLGKLRISSVNNAGNTTTLITNASQAGARTYTIPDAGASASFVLTEGSRTINGTTTFGNNSTFSGTVFLANGLAGSPSLSFSGDTNTGMYWNGPEAISFATNGTRTFTVSNTNSFIETVFGIQSGTAAAPGLYFNSSTTTGLFLAASNDIGFATNGIQRLHLTNTALVFSVDHSPTTDITNDNGNSTHRWLNLWAQTIHSGDIALDNGWKITEGDKVGRDKNEVLLISPEGKKFRFLTEEVE
jgi:hypothetical protein